jgi:integration host factor subunit alpha
MNDKISEGVTLLLPTIETPTLTKAELSEMLFERLG